jgi:hypothetical protein
MNKQHRSMRREEGQSLIIVGALLIVLVVLIGLVVDAGNAYAQRRIVQNAADAAALAGSQMLVHQEDYLTGGPFLRNWQVIAAAEDFAKRNGVDPNELNIYYTDISGNILADAKFDLGRQDIITKDTFGKTRAEGIRVEANRVFDTYLIRLIGRNQMAASGTANGILACGACTAGDVLTGGLFPIAVHQGLFDNSDGLVRTGQEYRIWGDKTGPGSFGYLSWNEDGGHTSEPTLVANMADTSRSGQWKVGMLIPTGPGVQDSSSVKTELQYRIDDRTDLNPERPSHVLLPLYDYTEGTGENLKYHITGFLWFRLNCYQLNSNAQGRYGDCAFDDKDNSKWISGVPEKYLEATGESGCTNYGVCTAKLRPPLEVKRTLVGNVVPWRVFVVKNAQPGAPKPVDVVHVLDISGSMCAHWDGSADKNPPCTNGERIRLAKQVVAGFDDGLDWDPHNQVGLATYPTIQNSSTYNTQCGLALGSKCTTSSQADCGKTNNLIYFAQKNANLTTNIASVNQAVNNLTANGGTSLPRGLQYGREMISDPAYHNADSLKVLILTTDGMPNVKIDGYASGYLGNYVNPALIVQSGCNDSVKQDAIEQANLAKQEGVIVFTIGIHTTIDEPLMKALASPDTDPSKPHFFKATTSTDFQAIYDQIEDRLPEMGNEECIANENATVGGGATVRLYDSGGNLVATTTADSSGGFMFTDLQPGTYELRASWPDHSFNPSVVYDLPTWTLGGDPLKSGEKILVTIPQGTGTTNKDVYLRTSQQFTCD